MRLSRRTALVFTTLFLATIAGSIWLLNYGTENQADKPSPDGGASSSVKANESPAPVEREMESPVPAPVSIGAPEQPSVSASVEPGIADVRPGEIYKKYANAELEGDLDAMAIQASVLRFCRDTAISGYADAIRESSLSDRDKESELLRFERCRPFVEMIGDVDAAYSRLHKNLYESGHPLILVSQGGVDADTKKSRLVAVFMNEYSEPHVYERAFMAAANYHLAYIEHKNELRREAWTILSCEASWRCDSSEYRQNIRKNFYHDHLYDQILEIEYEIRTALREKDPEGLGF